MRLFSFFRREEAPKPAPVPLESQPDVLKTLIEGQVKLFVAINEHELARLAATAEERQEEIAYTRQIRENKRAAAANAREALKRKRAGVPDQKSTPCLVCVNPTSPHLTIQDIARHRQHEGLGSPAAGNLN